MTWTTFCNALTNNFKVLLFMKIEFLEMPPNYVIFVSRIVELCPLQPVNDQNIYKKSSLESLFVETINSKKSNIIVGVIYRHRSMDVVDFSKNYLNRLSDKILKEVKNIFLLFDFDINLLRFNDPRPTNDFFESLACSSLFPYMLRLTQLTGHFKILFHNIFCNLTSCKKSQKI